MSFGLTSQTGSSYLANAKVLMHQQNPGVGIAYGKRSAFPKSFSSASNTVLSLSFGKKTVVVNYDKVSRSLTKSVAALNKDNLHQWFEQENTCLISSEINRVIDIVCMEYNDKLINKDRGDIFNKLQKDLKTDLTINGAQSSIKHVLRSDKYLLKKIDSLTGKKATLEQKNAVTSYIINSLTDRIFQQQYFGIDLSKLRDNVAEKTLAKISARS